MKNDPVDVVVVGGGAGGAPVAYELASAGLEVVILDKGRRYRDEEFDHDEIRMCRRNFFTPSVTDEPHTLRTGQRAQAARSTAGWVSTIVGGGTVHMAGYCHRLHPVDFKLRSTLGNVPNSTLVDWPITYEDLEPYYARVEREVGVSGVWRAHPFEEPRSGDFPLPPLAENAFAGQIDAACAKLGYHPFPTPRAILSRDYRGRQACMFCSLCVLRLRDWRQELHPGVPHPRRGGDRPLRRPPAVHGDRDPGQRGGPRHGSGLSNGRRGEHVSAGAVRRRGLHGHRERAPAPLVAFGAVSQRTRERQRPRRQEPRLLRRETKGQALFKRARGDEGAKWLVDAAPFVQRSMQDFYFLDRPVEGRAQGGDHPVRAGSPEPHPHRGAHRGPGSGARWGARLKQALRDEARGARTLTFESFAEGLPSNAARTWTSIPT